VRRRPLITAVRRAAATIGRHPVMLVVCSATPLR
jgi:hypothetical protein